MHPQGERGQAVHLRATEVTLQGAFLQGAVVQKVDRPSSILAVLTLRLPGRTVRLVIFCGGEGPAIGECNRALPRAPADAETMRWRKHLEGSRVVHVLRREGFARVEMLRDGEVRAIVATRARLALSMESRSVESVLLAPSEVATAAVATAADATVVTEAQADELAAQMSIALERHGARTLDERRRSLAAEIDRAAKKAERKIAAIAGDLAKMAKADEWMGTAALISANAHDVKRGARELVVDDWSSGEAATVTIALDPAKTAREQADALFHRAKRLKRGATVARDRLAVATRARDALVELKADAFAAEDEERIAAVAKRALTQGVSPPRAPGKKVVAAQRAPYHLFRIGAHTVLVGRGAKDNDELTLHVARPHDLWLHAKGTAGAHVVIPLKKGQSCPAELLVDAAHLAAHFSDARGEKVVEVTYVPKRYVRKPRGAAPGSVQVEREKVLVLRVDAVRLASLLQSDGVRAHEP